jgi:hypothetical protein
MSEKVFYLFICWLALELAAEKESDRFLTACILPITVVAICLETLSMSHSDMERREVVMMDVAVGGSFPRHAPGVASCHWSPHARLHLRYQAFSTTTFHSITC